MRRPRGSVSLGYTGVWNRDQDFVTGDRFLTDLCTALGA